MYNINYQYRNSYNNSNYYALPVSYKYTYDYVQEGNNNIIYPLLNSNINYKNQTPTKNIVPLFTQYQNDNVFYNYVPRTPSPSPIKKSLFNNYNQVKVLSKSPEPYIRLYTKNYINNEGKDYFNNNNTSNYNLNYNDYNNNNNNNNYNYNYNTPVKLKVNNIEKINELNHITLPTINFQEHEYRAKTPEPHLNYRKKLKKTKKQKKNIYNPKTFIPINNNEYELNKISIVENIPNINNQNLQNLEKLNENNNIPPYNNNNYSRLSTNNYYYQINNYPTKYIINQINPYGNNNNDYLYSNINYCNASNISDISNINNINNINNIYNVRENRFKSMMNCDDPTDNFSSADFIIVNQIGEGSFGKIYCVQWIKNNKLYAMKKLELKDIQELKQFQEKVRIVKKLNEKTNHCGFIKIFAENCTPAYNFQKAYNYYIIMELGERDWEKEIQMRLIHLKYYTEYELYQIIYQLVKTLSLMQKYNVTHRDIKPQNILIKNGIYKICDFGEARVISGNGVVIQHVRGSQLYMSPILFYAYNHNILQVMHNAYKSDVFSLGMCCLLAATLSGYTLYDVRELLDINAITKIVNNKLNGRYSINIINIIIQMLQVDENLRMDFIQLEEFIKQYWKY